MKYRFFSVAVLLAMLLLAFCLQNVDIRKNRYHQHREALPKTACRDHGDEVFCTHLPLMEITTDEPLPSPYLTKLDADGLFCKNDAMVGATIRYFDSETENNHLTDTPVVDERALIRIRGASSRKYDKTGYLIKFKEADLVTGKKVSLSGMTEDSEWALHGPFLDKTLIRNYFCYNLAGEIMDYAPNVRFCEIFVNGEYMGVYLIVEKVEYSEEGRIAIEKTNPRVDTTSYIVQIDRDSHNDRVSIETFASYSYITANMGGERRGYYQIEYPSSTLTEGQRQYIESDISRFEKALYSYDYKDKDHGYPAYIDVDSFVDYFLINEFTLNYDAMGLSTFLYRDIGGKMKLCVWDFNSAFDYYEFSVVSPETFSLQNSMWYSYLFKDKAFVDRVVSRYRELRESYFNEEYLMNYIDETVAYLGPAIDRNYEKWGYSFRSTYNGAIYDYLHPHERNPRNYEEAIAQLKNCISHRIRHMDSHIDRLYTLCHDSLNKSINYREVN